MRRLLQRQLGRRRGHDVRRQLVGVLRIVPLRMMKGQFCRRRRHDVMGQLVGVLRVPLRRVEGKLGRGRRHDVRRQFVRVLGRLTRRLVVLWQRRALLQGLRLRGKRLCRWPWLCLLHRLACSRVGGLVWSRCPRGLLAVLGDHVPEGLRHLVPDMRLDATNDEEGKVYGSGQTRRVREGPDRHLKV